MEKSQVTGIESPTYVWALKEPPEPVVVSALRSSMSPGFQVACTPTPLVWVPCTEVTVPLAQYPTLTPFVPRPPARFWKVKGEIGFTMLAYNMGRAINILGVGMLMALVKV